jgi:uncharacterized protein YndB with AHSA1/START domain
MERLHFEVDIGAPVATVWQAMLSPDTFRTWTDVFAAGSYYEGSWDQGARIRFLTPQGEGMSAEIAENRRHEFISIKHVGFIEGGVDDTESPEAKAWEPAFENYTFTEKNGVTTVGIDTDAPPEFESMFRETWPQALAKLKELCER